MDKNTHNLGKKTDMQSQKAHKVRNKMNSKRPTSRHTSIVIKNGKVKKTNFKGERGTQ